MYKFGKVWYAIQATVSSCHDCAFDKLEAFLADLDLQEDEAVKLVYAVPDGVFGRFVTKPVKPFCPKSKVSISHVCIPAPWAIGRNAATPAIGD